jgi:hypothetical protein
MQRRSLMNFTLILFLVAGILGLANLPLVSLTVKAQEPDGNLYLPLIMKNAFTRPQESIMILTPGPGSRVTNPVRISGISDPTFEQHLGIRVLREDGTEVAESFTTIQAEIGERGPFELDLDLELDSEVNIFILVFDTSARDGGIVHLSSVGVTFTPTGPEDINVRDPYPEQIVIFQPQTADTISGGTVHVSGFALAGFEQTLVVEVQDQDGDVIAMEPVMVEAPDLGFPGLFQVDIEYIVAESGPGRIVVRDISPAHGDNAHLNSVEVTLEP